MPETGASEELFSYGTLQLEAVQLATFGRRLTGRVDRVLGYRLEQLEIGDTRVVALSGKTHHLILVATGDAKDSVEGTVFAVTPSELAQADAYEVAEYKRVRANLASGSWAWVYVDARPADSTT